MRIISSPAVLVFSLAVVSTIAAAQKSTPRPPIHVAQLTSSNGVAGDEFGLTSAVCGNTVVIGASQLNSTQLGAAYVFVKGPSGSNSMTQTAVLTASDAAPGALFGLSVACDGNTIVVGAGHGTVGSNQFQGEAYVFVKPAGGWVNMTETARLTSSDGEADDLFGYSVAISGNTIVIGAPQASGEQLFEGKAYIYQKPAAGWQTTSDFAAELTANPQFDSGVGASVSISGNTVVAGSPNGGATTAAYVFVEPSTGWQTSSTYAAELTASDAVNAGGFGACTSISHDAVAVGAYLAGSVYMFVKPTAGWASSTETAKISDPSRVTSDFFGYSLWLTGNTLVVGAANAPQGTAAYVFVKPTGGWESTSTAQSKLTVAGSSIFAFSVAASPALIVAGSIGNNNLQGAAYVFTY